MTEPLSDEAVERLIDRLAGATRGLCTEDPEDYIPRGVSTGDALKAASALRFLLRRKHEMLEDLDAYGEREAEALSRAEAAEARLAALAAEQAGVAEAARERALAEAARCLAASDPDRRLEDPNRTMGEISSIFVPLQKGAPPDDR